MKEKSDIVYDTTVVISEDELLVRIELSQVLIGKKMALSFSGKQQTAMKPYRW